MQLEREGGTVEQPVGSKEIEGAWRFQCMGRCATSRAVQWDQGLAHVAACR